MKYIAGGNMCNYASRLLTIYEFNTIWSSIAEAVWLAFLLA